MFSLFKATETHPEAKSIAAYYQDLASAVEAVRAKIADADHDPAFKQAADVIAELVPLCTQLEIVPALEAREINKQRSLISRNMGPEGLIGVQGDASNLLAKKYCDLLEDLIDKKYWPVDTCPTFLGQSFLTKYAESFDDYRVKHQRAIDQIDARISAYENRATLKHTA